ncbi:MAG: PaaI family thioesterase [Halodesulfurarchaeum sp.]
MADVFDAVEPREFLQEFIDDHGFLSFLDLTVETLEPGYLVMRIPYDQKLTNQGPGNGNVHGGIASTLIDTAGGLCVHSALKDPLASSVATIDLNVSYLRPARGDLVGTAEVVRVGGSVGVATISVESEVPDGEVKEVAVGRGSFRIFRPEENEASR